MKSITLFVVLVFGIGCGADALKTSGDNEADAGEQEETGGCLPDPDASQQDVEASTEPEAAKDAPKEFDPDHELQDCPSDMAAVGAVCVDIYEASRPDATAEHQGTATGAAQSVGGVIPWYVPQMTTQALEEFKEACQAAGKRICEPSDWLAACEGPSGSAYVFGDIYNPTTCNGVDTFCQDWCDENGVASESCDTSSNCGYAYDCFSIMPTGSFPDCTNEYGTFDVTGNVWEIVPSTEDVRGFEVRGGAFNCAGAEARLQCTFNAGWEMLYAGFRCCLDR